MSDGDDASIAGLITMNTTYMVVCSKEVPDGQAQPGSAAVPASAVAAPYNKRRTLSSGNAVQPDLPASPAALAAFPAGKLPTPPPAAALPANDGQHDCSEPPCPAGGAVSAPELLEACKKHSTLVAPVPPAWRM